MTALAVAAPVAAARTYGTYTYVPGRPTFGSRKPRGHWELQLEPGVSTRVKRIFGRISVTRTGVLTIADSPEVARDLEWMQERWPLKPADDASAERLRSGADQHRETEQAVARILTPGARAAKLPMEPAKPPRDYQKVAVELLRSTGRLLLTDSVGLGKTLTGALNAVHADALPMLVVPPTHLPGRWLQELEESFPWLTTGVAQKTTPPKGWTPEQIPDVFIVPYSRLAGWAPYLHGQMSTVVFDEIQDLRKGVDTQKGKAAAHVSDGAKYKLGLSVAPESTVELLGGPFGNGWTGSISEATGIVAEIVSTERVGTHSFLRVDDLGIKSRGWTGEGFAWKQVKSFIHHPLDTGMTEIRASSGALRTTDEHSVYRVGNRHLEVARADSMQKGESVAVDDGANWAAVDEQPIDMIQVLSETPFAQVVVDTSGVTRHDLGLRAWQWQNLQREAVNGPRLPIDVYLQHADILPKPTAVYMRASQRVSPAAVRLSDWAYVLGYFLGNGWIENQRRVSFAVKKALVSKVIAELKALPNADIEPHVLVRKAGSDEVRFNNAMVARMFQSAMGKRRSYEKSIPGEWITSWPEQARRKLLEGMLDSDGHVSKRFDRRYYSTTSPALASSLHALLRSLGVLAGVNTKKVALGGVIDGRQIEGRREGFTVHWSALAEDQNNDGFKGRRVYTEWTRDKMLESKVRSAAPMNSNLPGIVYDLEMEGHPSFTANGILVHNTATPIYNYGGEIWNIYDIIAQGELGTRDEFTREWGRPLQNGSIAVTDPAALGSYLREQALMLGRTREEVGRELPETIKVSHQVNSDPAALNAVKGDAVAMAKLILAETSTRQQRMQAAGELDWKLRQATGIGKAPYVAEFCRMLLESEEKIILAGWHRSVYDLWNDMLSDFKPVMYTGSESPAQKSASELAFIEGDSRIMIMSLRSGAGLDGLQKVCSVSVFGELDWSPQVHEQLIGRTRRDGMGAKPPVAYFLNSAEGSDPAVMEALGIKRMQAEPMLSKDGKVFATAMPDAGRGRMLAEQILGLRAA